MLARPMPGWLVLAVVAGLIAVIAFASRSAVPTSGTVPIDFKPAFTLLRALAYAALAIGTLAMPFVVVMRFRARRDRAAKASRSERQLEPVPWWVRALGIAAMVAMFAFQIAVVLAFIDDIRRSAAGSAGGGAPNGGIDPSGLGHASDDLTSLTIALVIVLALAVCIAVLGIRWRVLDQPDDVDGRQRDGAVARAVDLSLDALRGEPDPRRAVIAAYAAMERSLARAGLGRQRHEAPIEYLRRVLTGSTPAADDVREITGLFQHAKFSQHEVGEPMRASAIESLTRIRAAFGGAA